MINRQIAGTGSDTALIAAITPDSPRISSLGSVLTDILAESVAEINLVIDLATGKIRAGGDLVATSFEVGNDLGTIFWQPTVVSGRTLDFESTLSGTSGSRLDFTLPMLTPGDGGTFPFGAEITAQITPSFLQFSLGALVDAIDRAYQSNKASDNPTTGSLSIVVVQNETNGSVNVRAGDADDDELTISSGTVTATFTATAPPANGVVRLWGE